MGRNDGSVAPKERINIVYKTHVGDAEEDVELPMRFLVLGDFNGRDEETPVEERKAISVDKDNFDDVLAAQDVAVEANVPNALSDNPEDELSVALRFKSMRDFSPDGVMQQVPELQKLSKLRDALLTLKGPLGNMPKFRKRIEALVDDPEAQKRLLEELGMRQDESETPNDAE